MDHRRYRHDWFTEFSAKRMQFTVEIDGVDLVVPAKYEVCGTCEGRGKHVNPSVDERGLSAEDFDEDPDLFDNYTSGMYDVQCAECHGLRVSPVPDLDRMTPEDAKLVGDYIADYYQGQREDYEMYRMETGYRD